VSKQRMESLVWILIYGGLLGACVGWFLSPVRGPWGELLITAGFAAVAAGVVLIVVRSRLKD
jgi:F0F1-type ATP synthase assembly protein I